MLKMTIGILSLLLFTACFAAATPMVQQQKTSPSDETTHQVASAYQSDKELNFIQKIILKKAQKKMKKVSDEDKYRKKARLSVALGTLAFLGIPGFIFMIMSVTFGVQALKSQNKRTRRLAISGIVLSVLLFSAAVGVFIYFINNPLPSSFCFAGC